MFCCAFIFFAQQCIKTVFCPFVFGVFGARVLFFTSSSGLTRMFSSVVWRFAFFDLLIFCFFLVVQLVMSFLVQEQK